MKVEIVILVKFVSILHVFVSNTIHIYNINIIYVSNNKSFQHKDQGGETEEVIGEILNENPELKKNISVHTKANPGITPLTREGLFQQMEDSLNALQLDCVDIWYLHAPDISTNYYETFSACNQLYKEGKFKELGLSNYASWDVVRVHMICRENNWVCPTVYQGLYNSITRSCENELIPALRACNMRGYWYNPVAGGLLTGRYRSMEDGDQAGRFSTFGFAGGATGNKSGGDDQLPGGSKIYRSRYFKNEVFSALDIVRDGCEKANISMAEAAVRWVKSHSALNGKYGDGLIFGASKLHHVEQNLQSAINNEPLTKDLIDSFDNAWTVASPTAENYMRGYGRRPGGSERFLAKY